MILSQENLLALTEELKSQNQKIVFTNGCFDILHAGHVRYLREAKKLGDILILGLNSDKSVKRLKGSERPINNEENRALVLSALRFVDFVCLFEEDTPYKLIESIKPDFLVKGGDWKENEIVGSDVVKQYGGQIISLPFFKGKSSTEIINKIRSNN